MPNRDVVILMADDDEEDRMMTREALAGHMLANEFNTVSNGEELMDYLYHRGEFSDPETSPRPGLILLDLKMPRKDGWEVLREIREDDLLRQIPIVVLTSSKAEEDVYRSYDLGVNSFITKPVTFEGLVEVMKALKRYWLEIVELPTGQG